ncbi:hypothetical protein ON010_g9762 [Phytophthora cinnamomi]|nr:hypothetical protein ON010_g9762 [Phytophthora cinnamomi]
MDPCEVIRLLEKDFGQVDAAGLIDLTRMWSKLIRRKVFCGCGEGALRRIFGVKSKKEIALMDKGKGIPILSKVKQAQKRKADSGSIDKSCYYCFEEGYFRHGFRLCYREMEPRQGAEKPRGAGADWQVTTHRQSVDQTPRSLIGLNLSVTMTRRRSQVKRGQLQLPKYGANLLARSELMSHRRLSPVVGGVSAAV